MNLPKTVKELKEQKWKVAVMDMVSMRRGVSYSAYISPDKECVACVDSSEGEVTMIFTRDPISVLWVNSTTRLGYDYLMGKNK